MRVSFLAALALAACGGSSNTTVDAGSSCSDAGPACGDACTATFTGNLDTSSVGISNCASLGTGSGSASSDVVLQLALSGTALDAPLAVSIDLGPSPTSGMYSSETAFDWSAIGSRSAAAIGSAAAGECVYSAGAEGVPTGSFTLGLTSIDPTSGTAHGELRIVGYVQAQEGVDCGSGDNEIVDAQF